MGPFKLIIAGGRDFNDRTLMIQEVTKLMQGPLQGHLLEIVSGMARGADMLAYTIAKESGITVHEHPADWNQYGKSAGYRRNVEMADNAQGLLAFWDTRSVGTKHMIDIATAKGLSVAVVNY